MHKLYIQLLRLCFCAQAKQPQERGGPAAGQSNARREFASVCFKNTYV